MLAGFSFDILKEMSKTDKVWRIKQNEQLWLWYLFSLNVLGLSMLLMTHWLPHCVRFGGQAKRQGGSFGVATNAMRSERGFALRCFAGGMLCFVAAIACYAILANVQRRFMSLHPGGHNISRGCLSTAHPQVLPYTRGGQKNRALQRARIAIR